MSGTSTYKTIMQQGALHNTKGGLIIYGIDKYFKIKTINDPDKIINKIKSQQDLLNHNIENEFVIIKYKDKNIIIQLVPEAPLVLKPVRKNYFIDKYSYYIKNHQIEEIPEYIINSLRAINHISLKESIDPTYKIKYDDVKLKQEFLKNYRKEYLTQYDLPDSEILRSLFSGYLISVHYILLFSYLPQHFFPYLYVNISDRRKGIKDYKITGSIFHMLKMSMLTIKKLLKYKLSVDKNGNLITKTTYIFEVIYEVLYNALIHRDYTYKYHGEPINIYIYKDKITITNPGYYISDNPIYLNSKFKYARNSSIKLVMDILSSGQRHGFKFIKRMSRLYKCKEAILYNQDDLFVATIFSMQEESIYKYPYTIEAIATYCMEPKTKIEIYNYFFDAAKKDYGYFFAKYIEPLIINGMLEYTIPEKPKSKFQKIKTSDKAIEMLFEH